MSSSSFLSGIGISNLFAITALCVLTVISSLWRLGGTNNVIAERLAGKKLALKISSAAMEAVALDALIMIPDILGFIRRKRRLVDTGGSRFKQVSHSVGGEKLSAVTSSISFCIYFGAEPIYLLTSPSSSSQPLKY
jgi:hypothetical protein